MSDADLSTSPAHGPRRTRTRWVLPSVCVVLGLAYLGAGIAGDNLPFGIFGLVLMLTIGGGVLVAGRWSETLAGLSDRGDERINSLDAIASQVAGLVVLLTVVVMFILEIARGESGSPYYQLGALGGVSYVVTLVYLRFRR